MLNKEFYLLILILSLMVGVTIFGYRKYNNIINPLSTFIFFDIGAITVLSLIVNFSFETVNGLESVMILTVIYIFGFVIVFIPKKPNTLLKLLYFFFNKLIRKSPGYFYSNFSYITLLLISFIIYTFLCIFSGAGLLWITDTRIAYQNYRAGVGIFYVLFQWTLMFSLIYCIWRKKFKPFTFFVALSLYFLGAYFTGSKGNFISGLILTIIYYNIYVNKIPFYLLILFCMLLFIIFFALLITQGSYSDVISSLLYFKDYAGVTGEFLHRFDEFEFLFGKAIVSDLWFYVPRGIYSEKPYEYGVLLIHKVLFPGAAELGDTPGILPWALWFLDFGAFGVLFYAIIIGFIRRGFYDFYLSNSKSIIAFIFMVNFSLIQILAYATLPIVVFICFIFSLFIKKRILLQ